MVQEKLQPPEFHQNLNNTYKEKDSNSAKNDKFQMDVVLFFW
ncbi:hypothetical protein ES705_47298 [subsurface metagenome]